MRFHGSRVRVYKIHLVFCRFSIEQITVKLGEYDFEKEGETLDSSYTLEQMIPHESYDTKTFENDIAILKLDRQVTHAHWLTVTTRGQVSSIIQKPKLHSMAGSLDVKEFNQYDILYTIWGA